MARTHGHAVRSHRFWVGGSPVRKPRISSACHRRAYEAANFISLIASLFVTAPPIRLTA